MDNAFSFHLLNWFDQHGRKDLPWQHPRTPYRVWVSEIMLQQTQVTTVIPYFVRFMERFSDVHQLAQAEQAEVLTYWSGLGYYARGRNLHKSAQEMVQRHNGDLPQTADELMSLSGIGQSTAHAILSLAYHQPKAICDGNVRRVLARWLALEETVDKPQGQAILWQTAESLQSHSRPADYTQAIMDLGATLCTRTKPKCQQCPVQQDCQAFQQSQNVGIAVTFYPRKSQKAPKPEKSCAMYLLQRPDGAVWLNAPQQDTGLWGGLYQLPQELPQTIQGFVHTAQLTQLPETQHSFTHFKLHIQPYWLALSAEQAQAISNSALGDWYHPEQHSLPRPAIVDKLVNRLANRQQSLL